MSVDDAHLALERAEMLIGRHLYAVHHPDALDTALRHGVSAYDARFLVAAEFLNRRLVTEDLKLRRAAPSLTYSLEEAMR
jgi:predicted nucleic acid-binding protein